MTDQTATDPPTAGEGTAVAAPARPRHRLRRGLLLTVAILLWVRFALFGWLFPMIERHVDNPEFDATETGAPVDPAVDATDG